MAGLSSTLKFTDSETLSVYVNRFLFCVPKGNSNVVDLDSPIPSWPKDLWILWIYHGPDIHLVLPQESGNCRHHPPELTVQVWYALKKKISCSLCCIYSPILFHPSSVTSAGSQQEKFFQIIQYSEIISLQHVHLTKLIDHTLFSLIQQGLLALCLP